MLNVAIFFTWNNKKRKTNILFLLQTCHIWQLAEDPFGTTLYLCVMHQALTNPIWTHLQQYWMFIPIFVPNSTKYKVRKRIGAIRVEMWLPHRSHGQEFQFKSFFREQKWRMFFQTLSRSRGNWAVTVSQGWTRVRKSFCSEGFASFTQTLEGLPVC